MEKDKEDLSDGSVSGHLESQIEVANVTDSQRQYLWNKYGTLELDPVPDGTDADPLNWPKAKKIVILLIVGFHAMMTTFTGAAVASAYVAISTDLNVSITAASYFVSICILFIGLGPLFWRPLADRFGRRPIFLVSLIISLVANIGCAESLSYAPMAVCRAIVGFAVSPAAALGSAVVAEMFFKHQRAVYMGLWTVMITLGVPLSPFIFGFVAFRVSYRWIYWVLAITNGVQFVVHFFLGSETLHLKGQERPRGHLQNLIRFERIDPKPLSFKDFVRPLRFFAWRCILLPTVAYSIIFGFSNIFLSVIMGALYSELLDFNEQQIGLQFISMIIGSLIGEVIGGLMSDYWMKMRRKRIGSDPNPEFRLWLSYPAYALSVVGIAVFLVCIGQDAPRWTVSPDVGIAIAAAGNQIVTTVLITYAVDCYRQEAAAIGVFVNFVRQVWGFIGPFWFEHMITSVGLRGSAGILAGIIIVICFPASGLLQWRGPDWRESAKSKEMTNL